MQIEIKDSLNKETDDKFFSNLKIEQRLEKRRKELSSQKTLNIESFILFLHSCINGYLSFYEEI